MDAVVVIVGHGHDPAGAEVDVDGEPIPVVARPACSDMICERAVGVEHLDAVLARVGHGQDPAGAEVDADRFVKLARAKIVRVETSVAGGVVVAVVVVILRSQLIGKRAVGVEHHDVAVPAAGHGQDAARAEGDAFRAVKHDVVLLLFLLMRSGLVAVVVVVVVVVVILLLRYDLIGKRAVGVVHHDAVLVKVGHGQYPAGAEGDAANTGKIAGDYPVLELESKHGPLRYRRGRGRPPSLSGRRRQPRRGRGNGRRRHNCGHQRGAHSPRPEARLY